ncbi:MAG: hypothetical protein JXA74_17625 [Anaerolineae bacterium]|nr:hypothetical protein [Anaerolineae bacterium]
MTSLAVTRSEEGVQVSVGLRMGISVALSLMTTAMLILAFPPYNVWPLAFFCLVPMLVAQYRLLPRRWAALAPCIGGDLWVLWLVTALFAITVETAFILLIPVIALVKDWLGARGNRQFHELTRYRWFVLEGVFGWVGFEMIRSFIPLIRTYGFIGHTVHTQAWLIQPVSVFSIYGLDLLIMLVNYGIAQGILALLDRGRAWDGAPKVDALLSRRWLIGIGAALLVWVALSLIMLSGTPTNAPTVRVAGVSHDFHTAGHIDTEASQTVRLASLVEQTRLAAQEGAELVIWPELAIGFDPRVEHRDEIVSLVRETQAHIMMPFGRAREGESRNASVIVNPAGEFLAVSGKSHPSPGEGRDPEAATYPVYETPLGRLATIICNDANFTDSSRILARKGAQLIAAPTLETSVKGMEIMYYVQMVFHAVENRVATVAAGNFTTAMMDPYGRILAVRAHPSQRRPAPMVADVPLGAGEGGTLYTRVGDWVGWLSLAGFAFFAIYPDQVRKRAARKADATHAQR